MWPTRQIYISLVRYGFIAAGTTLKMPAENWKQKKIVEVFRWNDGNLCEQRKNKWLNALCCCCCLFVLPWHLRKDHVLWIGLCFMSLVARQRLNYLIGSKWAAMNHFALGRITHSVIRIQARDIMMNMYTNKREFLECHIEFLPREASWIPINFFCCK